MSALGHKQTYAVQKGMSALPPKADICGAITNVRFVPRADSCDAADGVAVRSPCLHALCAVPFRYSPASKGHLGTK